MIDQTYQALFYWWERPESPKECAERLARFLSEIQSMHQEFSSWEIMDRNAKLHAMPKNAVPALSRAFEAGCNRNELDGRPIEDLGFRIGLSNAPLRKGGIQISAKMGGFSEWLVNVFLFGPIKASETPELAEFPMMLKLVHAIVRHIEPDYGLIRSEEYDELVTDFDDPDYIPQPGKPKPGWIVYLADGYWEFPSIPHDVYHEHIPDRGDVYAVVSETFDASNPAHVEAANRFAEVLESGKRKKKR
jgi:hypothetical protein